MYIHTPGWHTIYFINPMSVMITRVRRWYSGRRWHSGRRCRRFWWRCVGFFVPQACQQIRCFATLAQKVGVDMTFIKHCRVLFNRSLHLSIPWKLKSSLLLFLDFGTRLHNKLLRFLYRGAQKPSCCHFGHIQGHENIRLF